MPASPFPITREMYIDLLDAFREHPGDHMAVAAKLGIHRRSALKAWKKGWVAYDWAPPIEQELERERMLAAKVRREQREREQQVELDRLATERAERIEARADELLGAKTSRKGAIAFALVAQKMVRTANAVADGWMRKTASAALVDSLEFAEMRDILRTAAVLVDKSERILRLALEIERMVSGEPTQIHEHRIKPEGTVEDRVLELQRIQRILEGAKQRGMIVDAEPVKELSP